MNEHAEMGLNLVLIVFFKLLLIQADAISHSRINEKLIVNSSGKTLDILDTRVKRDLAGTSEEQDCPCRNEGVCLWGTSYFFCVCKFGYHGGLCQFSIGSSGDWPTANCGQYKYGEITGQIASPFHPDDYHNNHRCYYIIATPGVRAFKLTFNQIRLEDDFDYLVIGKGARFDWHSKLYEFTGILQDSQVPEPIEVVSEYVWMYFYTDFVNVNTGFNLTFLADVNDCIYNPCPSNTDCVDLKYNYQCIEDKSVETIIKEKSEAMKVTAMATTVVGERLIPTTTPVFLVPTPSPRVGHCTVWSQKYYRTFDGKHFIFDSTCSLVLVKDCEDFGMFSIYLTTEQCGKVICNQRLTITMEAANGMMTLQLRREGKEAVVVVDDNVDEFLTQSTTVNGVEVQFVSGWVVISSTIGFNVIWDGMSRYTVDMTSTDMSGSLCGLCGNYNELQEDDFSSPQGTIELTAAVFASSWKTDDQPGACSDENKQCTVNSIMVSVCENLRGGVFEACNQEVDVTPYIESCQQYMCECARLSAGDFENVVTECSCDAFSAYASACAWQQQVVDWRSSEHCFVQCPEGMEYQVCGSTCPQTCGNQVVDCENDYCIEGCHCPAGQMLLANKCIAPSECQCEFDGQEMQPGSVMWDDSTQCVCTDGKWDCSNYDSPGRCWLAGDDHFKSFDGKYFDAAGNCEYVLATDSLNSNSGFTVNVNNYGCSVSGSKCSRAVIITVATTRIRVRSSEILVNDENVMKLPADFNGVLIERPTTSVTKVTLSNGLQVEITKNYRVTLIAPPSLQNNLGGLCGTFNKNQEDDFYTQSGDIETTAQAFVSKWQTSALCETPKFHINFCMLHQQKVSLADDKCAILKAEDGPFSGCLGVVDSKAYHEACISQVCGCKTDACRCTILEQYAADCNAKHVILHWRDKVPVCAVSCDGDLVYKECAPSCESSCASLSSGFPCQSGCVSGCTCPDGLVLAKDGSCVTPSECPCPSDHGLKPPGFVIQSLCGPCKCTNGRFICEKEECSEECGNNMEFSTCAPSQVKTCANMQSYKDERQAQCIPGCICKDGFVFDEDSKECVKHVNCPCPHGGNFYQKGQDIVIGCNKCTCMGNSWKCEEKQCPGICTAWGDPHFTTFDGKKFDFHGDCDYEFATNMYNKQDDGHEPFRVVIKNVPCGVTGVTCTKSIKLTIGSGRNKDKVHLIRGKPIRLTSKNPDRIRVSEVGLYVFVHTNIGVTLIWSKGTWIQIKLDPYYKGQVSGLCGNFNGNQNDDFTKRSGGIPAISASEFGQSWKLYGYCVDTVVVPSSCSLYPLRELWSQRKCAVMRSDVFSACHSVVSPDVYIQQCVNDACNCNDAAGCENLCTSISAYAHQCSAMNVSISWRNQYLCPIQCQGCQEYKPCISVCNTCENTFRLTEQDDSSSKCPDTCVEGCACPEGQVMQAGQCVHMCDAMPTQSTFVAATHQPDNDDIKKITTDTTQMTDKTTQMTDSTTPIASSVTQMTDINTQPPSGVTQMIDSNTQPPFGATQMADSTTHPSGATLITGSTTPVPSGVTQMTDSNTQPSSGATQKTDSNTQPPSGVIQMTGSTTPVPSGVAQMTDSITQQPSGATQMTDSNTQPSSGATQKTDRNTQPPSGATQKTDSNTQPPSGATQMADSTTQQPSGVIQMTGSTTPVPSSVTQMTDSITQQPSGATQKTDSNTQPPSGATQKTDSTTQQPSGGATQKTDSNTQQPSGVIQITGSTTSVPSSVTQMTDSATQKTDSTTQQPSGVIQMTGGTTPVPMGVTQMTDSITQQPSGATQKTDSNTQPPSGATQMTDSNTQPPSGATQKTDSNTQPPSGVIHMTGSTTPVPSSVTQITDSNTQPSSGATQKTDSNTQPPSGATQKTDSNTQPPSGATQKTDSNTQPPSGATQKTDSITQQPSGVIQMTGSTTPVPSGVTQMTDSITQQPSGATQKTDSNTQQPSGVIQITGRTTPVPSGVTQMTDSDTQSSSGATQKTDSNTQPPSGATQMADSTTQQPSGVIQMTGSTTPVPSGVTQMTDSITQQPSGATQKMDSNTQPPSGVIQITGSTTPVPSGVAQMTDSITQQPSGATQKTDSNTQQPSGVIQMTGNTTPVPSGVAQMTDSITQQPSGATQKTDSNTQQPSGATQKTDSNTQPPSGVTQITDSITQQPSGATQKTDSNTQPPSGVTQKTDSNTQPPSGVAQMTGSTTPVPSGVAQMTDSITQQPSGATLKTDSNTQQPSGATQKTDSITQQPSGVTQITDSITQQPSGATQKADSATQQPSGATQMAGSTTPVPSGFTHMTDSDTQPSSGATQTTDSTTQQPSGVTQMTGSTAPAPSSANLISGSTTQASGATQMTGSTTRASSSATQLTDSNTQPSYAATQVTDSTTQQLPGDTETTGSTTRAPSGATQMTYSNSQGSFSATQMTGGTTQASSGVTHITDSTTQSPLGATRMTDSTAHPPSDVTQMIDSTTPPSSSATQMTDSNTQSPSGATQRTDSTAHPPTDVTQMIDSNTAAPAPSAATRMTDSTTQSSLGATQMTDSNTQPPSGATQRTGSTAHPPSDATQMIDSTTPPLSSATQMADSKTQSPSGATQRTDGTAHPPTDATQIIDSNTAAPAPSDATQMRDSTTQPPSGVTQKTEGSSSDTRAGATSIQTPVSTAGTQFTKYEATSSAISSVHQESTTSPCANYCSEIYSTVFERCHAFVNPELYHIMCEAEHSVCSDCIIIETYATRCSHFGIHVEWRNDICEFDTSILTTTLATTAPPETSTVTDCPNECSALYSDRFKPCHAIMNPDLFYASCQAAHMTCTECSVLETYAQICQNMGVCMNWRSDGLCAVDCPFGEEFRACICRNEEHCGTDDSCSAVLMVSECACPDGFGRISGECQPCPTTLAAMTSAQAATSTTFVCPTSVIAQCELLMMDVFKPCHGFIDPDEFVQECKATCNSHKCPYLQSYANKCQSLHAICLEWRSEDLCSVSCGTVFSYGGAVQLVYKQCVCSTQSCGEVHASCLGSQLVSKCMCPTGMQQSGNVPGDGSCVSCSKSGTCSAVSKVSEVEFELEGSLCKAELTSTQCSGRCQSGTSTVARVIGRELQIKLVGDTCNASELKEVEHTLICLDGRQTTLLIDHAVTCDCGNPYQKMPYDPLG